MNGWERLVEWAATIAIAALTWVSGIAAPVTPAEQGPILLAWAQDDAPPVEAVDDGDVEMLDQGAPPAAEPQPVSDTQAQDDVPLDPTGQPDVELLDQGSPPPAQPVPVETVTTDLSPAPAPAPAPVTATAPAPVYAAAPAATGPALPPGFGTGRVHVSAGSAGFPEGLADCHVGAVTGRAYVGIGCGGDASFVGHAPSFTDFPFVVEAPFPFDSSDEAVFETPTIAPDETNDVFVSAVGSRTARPAGDATDPEVETAGDSSVSLFQSAREREPRIRVSDRDPRRSGSDKSDGKDRVSSQRSDGSSTSVQAESKKQKAKDGKKKQKAGDGKNKDNDKDKDKKKSGKDGKDKKQDRDKKDRQRSSKR